jgi:hypothetical protein
MRKWSVDFNIAVDFFFAAVTVDFVGESDSRID